MTRDQRLKALEDMARLRATKADQARSEAYGRAIAALRAALPDDRPQHIESGLARRVIYSAGHHWHPDKLYAFLARLAADAMTVQDRAILDGLPIAELDAIGLAGAELVAMLSGLNEKY